MSEFPSGRSRQPGSGQRNQPKLPHLSMATALRASAGHGGPFPLPRCPQSHEAAKSGSNSWPRAAVQGNCTVSGTGEYGGTSAGVLRAPRGCFLSSRAETDAGFL